ncbi:rhodanese-like domain-containing protein [Haloarchaeobius sp. TZWWS8]|uniref:rhodanese-like domain-containing protein n=1 Tax=Haloarchaeobius sp. TZWWS8 TaxID=3446121 RepID=UPI003EB92608
MKRRTFLSGVGVSLTGLAGCLGGGGGSGDDKILVVDGETIYLTPVDKTYEWYKNGEAKFADARGESAYQSSHIEGAVSSPANSPISNSPVEKWSKDQKIVCYCGCPHHLSSVRAAELQKAGYKDVSVIDEGFYEWQERGYPVTGSSNSSKYEIRGQTDASFEGETVMLRWQSANGMEPLEAAFVEPDGSYAMTVHFDGVTPESVVSLEAPDYSVETTLGALTTQVVTADSVESLERPKK